MTEDEFRQKLTPDEYHILREKGTEAPFTGEYVDNHDDGIYACRACGQELFRSSEKFESGSGWPSFYDVADQGRVVLTEDNSHGMRRVEATCSNCGSHLGHVFPDGPRETTGVRYCINSASLAFTPKPPVGSDSAEA